MQYGTRMREAGVTIRVAGLACALALGVSGCRHRTVVPPLPPITQPVDIVTTPPDAKPPMVEAAPVKLPPPPVASAASKPRRTPRRSTKPASPAVTPPAQVASAEPGAPSPEQTAIGALSSGGDSNPKAQQDAADLIASIEKRLTALTSHKVDAEKAQISKIKNFQRQAQQALASGDAEGAKTLATKAKLLLDDLEK
jgi:ribosomal protein S20